MNALRLNTHGIAISGIITGLVGLLLDPSFQGALIALATAHVGVAAPIAPTALGVATPAAPVEATTAFVAPAWYSLATKAVSIAGLALAYFGRPTTIHSTPVSTVDVHETSTGVSAGGVATHLNT